MDYHLERKIRLSEDPEYKNLYKWCLQELGDDNKQIGEDQIPWRWSHYFTGSDLTYKALISSEDMIDDGDDTAESKSVELQEFIIGTLRPGSFKAGNWDNATKFSMFGTSRTINVFHIRILKIEGKTSFERCEIWGCVSYTSEIDFRDETEDDVVEIHLFLLADKFDRIARMIIKGEIDQLQLRLTCVSGFYSSWSPSIRTRHVKILASGSEQEIMHQEDSNISPPRLGEIGEFDLQVIRQCSLDLKHGILGSSAYEREGIIANVLRQYLDKNLPKGPKEEEDSWSFYSQFNEVANQIARSVAEYSNSQGESSLDFEDRLHDAFGVLTSIRYATNEKTRARWLEKESDENKLEHEKAMHTIWHHGEALLAFQGGYESQYARNVEVDTLQQESRRYLLRPWMENETLEWIIVDALAFSTVTDIGEELKRNAPGPANLLGLNTAYYSSKGEIDKMFWKQIQYGLSKFAIKIAIFLFAPVALGWYFWSQQYQDEVAIVGALYAGLATLYFSYRLIRWMFGKKPQTIFEKYQGVLSDMFLTYDMLKGEIISPTAIRERLLDTARRGAAWPGAMFSILDHAIQRNPAVWGDRESDRYQ